MKIMDIKNINDHFKYVDGLLIRRKTNNSRHKVGELCGYFHKSSGYMYVGIKGKEYQIHRVVWTLFNGIIPYGYCIDHIDHNKTNNRIENLRIVTHSENMKNQIKRKNNTSGKMGVYWKKANKKWASEICIDGKQIHLGLFLKYSDAVDSRKNAEVLYGFHNNHGKEGF